MTSVLSWQNSISLCPASFCTPRPNLPVIHYLFYKCKRFSLILTLGICAHFVYILGRSESLVS